MLIVLYSLSLSLRCRCIDMTSMFAPVMQFRVRLYACNAVLSNSFSSPSAACPSNCNGAPDVTHRLQSRRPLWCMRVREEQPGAELCVHASFAKVQR